jgi:hypothetical protein
MSRIWASLAVMVLATSQLGMSCGQSALAIMPGVVNNTGNRQLRREMFAFAIDQLCREMQARSVPLKLRDADPDIGRFFPNSCNVQEMANENLFVQFGGHGYAWTNVTGRMGFEATAAVEYNHDFLMDGSTMYVYFRRKMTQSSNFRVLMVERANDARIRGVASLLGSTIQGIAERVGDRILEHQLARGFTVVRESDGAIAFTLGVLEKGDRPSAPYDEADSSWLLLANERTELHNGQRDYCGPFTVGDSGDEQLWVTALVEGAPQVDLLVVAKSVGDEWIKGYEREGQPLGPPGPPAFETSLGSMTPGTGRPWRQALRLPKGSYYLVFDHTPAAGQSTPPALPYDDRAALVSYAVQLGDPP